jgi:DNA-binding IscR family transcriptional regulator
MGSASERHAESRNRTWALLSPHGFVLFYLAMNPEATLRDMSQNIGLTERTLYSVIKDLSSADMVRVARIGRRNSYNVNADAHFVHPLFAHLTVKKLLDALKPE